MEKDEEGKAGESQPPPHTQQPCRFFSQGRHCSYGKKCRFLHVTRLPNEPDAAPLNSENPGETVGDRPPLVDNSRAAPAGPRRRPCRYFLSGYCAMEDRCRFWHPPQFPLVDNLPVAGSQTRPAQRKPPVPHPSVLHEVKLCDLTEETTGKLRDTEIKQLKKRFPKDQLIIQERSDGKMTYYRMAVAATDPDWPFDLKEIDVMVSFPDNYPQEIFTVDIPLDQALPSVMARHVQQASLEWLQAKHATNQLMGKVELLFRPFLRWLDRSLERLFTEGARQANIHLCESECILQLTLIVSVEKDVDLEKAGLQFISYQELQATVCEKSETDHSADPASDTTAAAAATDADEDTASNGELVNMEGEGKNGEDGGCKKEQYQEEDEEDGEEVAAASHLVENIKISNSRRGTEVKVLGLRLGENTATVVAQQITVCLQCNRCKVTADLTLTGRTACTAQCDKCSSSISAAFRPCVLHHYSDVLGYLDLHNVVPTDLVLQDCDFIVGCLSCSQESLVQNLSYGQTKEFNCEHCHSKLNVLTESVKFQYIAPRPNKTGTSAVNLKVIRDPAVQKGKPLPEKGTCKHYKQSHRWLRFPCCGRAYPCDGCHDEDQDHPMELATRMLCGYCAKEQPYNNGKPCVSCGSMLTRGARTSHWEGGLGCRSKVKMNRNDRQKYANTNKTISRKAASEKK